MYTGFRRFLFDFFLRGTFYIISRDRDLDVKEIIFNINIPQRSKISCAFRRRAGLF